MARALPLVVTLAALVGCGGAPTSSVPAAPPGAPARTLGPVDAATDEPTGALRISPAAFALVDGAHPWSDESIGLDCAQGAAGTDDAMRVETGICRYGVWSALAERDVAPSPSEGARLTFTFWHDGLVASEPAEGHLGVAVDGVVVVDATEPIPSAPAWRAVDVALADGVRAGAAIEVHLHNHGANHWGFGPMLIEVRP